MKKWDSQPAVSRRFGVTHRTDHDLLVVDHLDPMLAVSDRVVDLDNGSFGAVGSRSYGSQVRRR